MKVISSLSCFPILIIFFCGLICFCTMCAMHSMDVSIILKNMMNIMVLVCKYSLGITPKQKK
jgi:hypothetical protein